MERYEAYKDSGIEWIGEIPIEWKLRRLKLLGSTRSGMGNKKPDDFGTGRPFLSYKDVYSRESFTDATGLVESTDDDLERYSVLRGDAFFTGSSETIEELGFSSVCLANIPKATFNGFTIRFRPYGGDLHPEYSAYLFRSDVFRGYLRQRDNSITRANLSQQTLGDAIAVLPTLTEQQAVADYLDARTAEVDALVTDCEREVGLLREYRKAVISEAVTRGLDPDAPMRDSGVDWIGEIPEGWRVQTIRSIARVVRGASPRPAGDPKYFDGDYMPWITVAEVTNCVGKYINKTSSYLTEHGSLQSRVIEQETLLMSNSGATLGVPRISRIRGCINDGSVAFLNVSVDIDFLYYALASMTDRLREMVKYGGQPNLNTEIVKAITIAIPPLTEQKAIAGRLDAKTTEIDSLIDTKQAMADKLREYRRSLISEAVTGKFKVQVA